MDLFLTRHASEVKGTLSGFDRVRFRGTLRWLTNLPGMGVWLSHAGVDRTSALLPWQAPPDVARVSPVDASARYLRHLAAAWNHKFAVGKGKTALTLEEQELVLTVPASFDAAARDLTMQAAARAGLKNLILLEEPQAALYAWLESSGENFRKQVKVGDVILVVDVGGGTTDLSLMAVTVSASLTNSEFHRPATSPGIGNGADRCVKLRAARSPT